MGMLSTGLVAAALVAAPARSQSETSLRAQALELAGGHHSPASAPEHFVDVGHGFQRHVSQPEEGFTAFLAEVEAAQVQLVNGRPGAFKALWSHRDDVTLSGGLGGAIAKGWSQVSERLDWVASQYADGTRTHEQVSRSVGQDLAYVVLRETIRFKAPGGGREVVQVLRVTQVCRWEDGRWRIVHRHADSQVTRQAAR